MSKHRIGSLIAIKDDDGKVYMGIVSARTESNFVVDVIADDVYRGYKLGRADV